MKKITKIAFAFFLLASVSMNAQTALKKGSVTYKMTMTGNDEAAAMMGESTISVHFDEKNQATDMNMMGGMMTMKTITPVGNLKDAKMAIEVMGMKYEIIEIGEEYQEIFEEHGGEKVQLVPGSNDHPRFIDCIVEMIEKRL